MGEFGNKFRKAREKKALSLEDVANVTKIGSRMLQAIEDERFDQLPGGVFNKGFIRAYAKHLGLNDEQAVTDYLACLRQAQIDALDDLQPAQTRPVAPGKSGAVAVRKPQTNQSAAKSQPAPVEELPDLQLPRAEHIRPRRNDFLRDSDREFPWAILAAATVVIILAVTLWVRHSHKIKATAAAAPPVRIVQPTASAPALMPAVGAPATKTPRSSVSISNSPSPQGTQLTAATHPVPAAAQPAAYVSPSNSTIGNQDRAAPSVAQSNSSSSSSDPSTAPLTLVIRANESSWISVVADGQPVSQETLIAPAHTSFRAKREIVAKIGNAAGVTFLWNGQEIPATGAEAEVKTFVFDAQGMRVQSPAPPPAQ